MYNKALDCISTHTDNQFLFLENSCNKCTSRNICREVLTIGNRRLTELYNENKADIIRNHQVTANWQSIGCNN